MNTEFILSIITVIAALISSSAGGIVTSIFSKYSVYKSPFQATGREVCQILLWNSGIHDVEIIRVPGENGYYDFSHKQIGLSDDFYSYDNMTAMAASAHECGHAMQHHDNMVLVNIRKWLSPAYVVSNASWVLVLLSLVITGSYKAKVLMLGAAMYWVAALFMFVTLPIEIDASRRALEALEKNGMVDKKDIRTVKKILFAAAFTYIAKTGVYIVELVRVIAKLKGKSVKTKRR